MSSYTAPLNFLNDTLNDKVRKELLIGKNKKKKIHFMLNEKLEMIFNRLSIENLHNDFFLSNNNGFYQSKMHRKIISWDDSHNRLPWARQLESNENASFYCSVLLNFDLFLILLANRNLGPLCQLLHVLHNSGNCSVAACRICGLKN